MTTTTLAAMTSSQSTEWYTPPFIIEAARAVLGGIDLDPASCDLAQSWIRAETYYTLENSGLSHQWWAHDGEHLRPSRVWLNPPFGRVNGKSGESSSALWLNRLVLEAIAGRVASAIILIPASVNDKWFQAVWKQPFSAVCFPRQRVPFLDETGKPSTRPTRPIALAYIGGAVKAFHEVFDDVVGPVVTPSRLYR